MRRDKSKTETVPKHPNFAKLDQINKRNNLPQRFFLFNCRVSMRCCHLWKWEQHLVLKDILYRKVLAPS